MNIKKGAISTTVAIVIVVVILIIAALAYWYISANPGVINQPGTTATTTAQGDNSGASSVTVEPTGNKLYTNFQYGYSLLFPADAENNISTPASVSFGFKNGTSTQDATLKISVAIDVNRLADCYTIPQGATGSASTTINGTNFLSYTVSNSTAANSGTTFYRVLHKDSAQITTCYDIEKVSQASTTLSTKLNTILQSFTFNS